MSQKQTRLALKSEHDLPPCPSLPFAMLCRHFSRVLHPHCTVSFSIWWQSHGWKWLIEYMIPNLCALPQSYTISMSQKQTRLALKSERAPLPRPSLPFAMLCRHYGRRPGIASTLQSVYKSFLGLTSIDLPFDLHWTCQHPGTT